MWRLIILIWSGIPSKIGYSNVYLCHRVVSWWRFIVYYSTPNPRTPPFLLFDKPRTFTTKKALLVNLFRKNARHKLPLDLAPAAIFLFRYWVHKSFLDRLHFPLEMWFHGSAYPLLDYSCFPEWEVSICWQNAICVSLCMCPRLCKSRPVNPLPFQSASCF